MAGKVTNLKLIKGNNSKPLFPEPSDHSKSIAQVLRLAEERGMSRTEIVNQYMGQMQDPEYLVAIGSSFELAHAFLLVGSQIQIFHKESKDA